MKTLKEDWKNYKEWSQDAQEVQKVDVNNLTFFIQEADTGFLIGFNTPYGTYSEVARDYKNIYDILGHIFCEEGGVIDNLLNK